MPQVYSCTSYRREVYFSPFFYFGQFNDFVRGEGVTKSCIAKNGNANRAILLILGFVISEIILNVRLIIFRILLGWECGIVWV